MTYGVLAVHAPGGVPVAPYNAAAHTPVASLGITVFPTTVAVFRSTPAVPCRSCYCSSLFCYGCLTCFCQRFSWVVDDPTPEVAVMTAGEAMLAVAVVFAVFSAALGAIAVASAIPATAAMVLDTSLLLLLLL